MAWLVIFTKGISSENPYDTMASINEKLAESLTVVAGSKDAKAGKLRIGYVDIHEDGELLKETFDLDAIPSVRLVKDDKVYHLKWVNGLWSTQDIEAFIKDHEESSLYDFKRSRVTDGIFLSLEYVINTLAEQQFTSTMENYLWAKKLIFENTGYKHDLKHVNPNMGKKKAFKKSQMRTLLIHVVLPAVLLGTSASILALLCLCSCL